MEVPPCLFWVCFFKSDPDSSDAELRFPAAKTADGFMFSSSSDLLMLSSAAKFSQCGGSHEANLKAGFVQLPYVLAKMNSKFAYMFLITTFPTFQTFWCSPTKDQNSLSNSLRNWSTNGTILVLQIKFSQHTVHKYPYSELSELRTIGKINSNRYTEISGYGHYVIKKKNYILRKLLLLFWQHLQLW